MSRGVLTSFVAAVVLLVAAGSLPAQMGLWDKDLTGIKVLLVIAPNRFNAVEYHDVHKVFKDLRATVQVASLTTDSAHASKGGATVTPTVRISDAKASDYDVVVFLGGQGMEDLYADPGAQALARDAVNGDKYLGAISTGPVVLANAGVLKERNATCHPSVKDQLVKAGATWQDSSTVWSDKVVTGKNPDAARWMAVEIVKHLDKERSFPAKAATPAATDAAPPGE